MPSQIAGREKKHLLRGGGLREGVNVEKRLELLVASRHDDDRVETGGVEQCRDEIVDVGDRVESAHSHPASMVHAAARRPDPVA